MPTEAFQLPQFSGRQLRKVAAHVVAIAGWDQFQDVFADELAACEAVKFTGGGVHVQHDAGQRFDEDHVGGVLKQRAESLLALREFLHGQRPRGDVLVGAVEANRPTKFVTR